MTLKIVRFEMSREFVAQFPIAEMLTDVARVEILNAYQYESKSIFSLQRFRFKPNRNAPLDKILKDKLKVEYYELLDHQGDEVLCILKQKRDTGLFSIFGQGPWAVLFPINVWEDVVQCQVLAEEQYLSSIYEILSKSLELYRAGLSNPTDAYQIISVNNIDGTKDLDKFGQFQTPRPNFTAKQKDVATYAAHHGYFESPKRTTGKAIAEHFGLTVSAANIRLKNAENLAMKYFFGGA